jgi:hypothetical protein
MEGRPASDRERDATTSCGVVDPRSVARLTPHRPASPVLLAAAPQRVHTRHYEAVLAASYSFGHWLRADGAVPRGPVGAPSFSK